MCMTVDIMVKYFGRQLSMLVIIICLLYYTASQSDAFSFNQPTTPTTPGHSSIFSEGCLSTTLDRPSKKKIQNDESQNVESKLHKHLLM